MVQEDFLSVKEVAEMLETEPYVLRFYEKELNLNIKRNVKGHRVYTLEDVELFKQIQDMREQGLQLKAIETIFRDLNHEAKETYGQLSSIQVMPMETLKKNQAAALDITDIDNDKVKQFSAMMKDMFKQALVEYSEESKTEIKREIQQEVNVAVEKKFTEVVEKKFTEIDEMQSEKNEAYYRKLDEAMREVQKMRKEMAETLLDRTKHKASIWSKLFGEKEKPLET